MFIGYFVIGLCALRHFGVLVGATLSITFEDLTIDVLDPKYFSRNDTVTHIDEDDDSMIGIRFTIIEPLPERGEGHITTFGLSMGEYQVPTGLDVEMPLCEMIEEPIIIGPIFHAMGFVAGSCPVPSGTYEMRRYKLPIENFPDEFPENKYQGKFEISMDGKIIMSIRAVTDMRNVYDR